jgi:hypothetical protein
MTPTAYFYPLRVLRMVAVGGCTHLYLIIKLPSGWETLTSAIHKVAGDATSTMPAILAILQPIVIPETKPSWE